jgi:hypothetical protein
VIKDWVIEVRFPSGSHRAVSVDQPASYPKSTGIISRGIKRWRCEAKHTFSTTAELRMCGAIPPLPHTSLWRGDWLGLSTGTTLPLPQYFFFFSFLGCGELSPVGTSANIWPIVPAPDDRWWVWSSRWNEDWQGKPKYSEKTCPSVTLSTTNPTWPDLESNPDRRGRKPATNLPLP